MMRERCSSSLARPRGCTSRLTARVRAHVRSAGVTSLQQRLRILAARHQRARQLQAVAASPAPAARARRRTARWLRRSGIRAVRRRCAARSGAGRCPPAARTARAGSLRPRDGRRAVRGDRRRLRASFEPGGDDFAVRRRSCSDSCGAVLRRSSLAMPCSMNRTPSRAPRAPPASCLFARKRLRVPPPGHGGRHAVERGQVVGTVQFVARRVAASAARGLPSARRACPTLSSESISDATRALSWREPPRALEMTQRRLRVALAQGQLTLRGCQA